MNRTTRTIVVMSVATMMATLASVAVYLAIKRIPVREVEVVAGFVAPGTRVDVVVTLRGQGQDETMSRTVVGNVLVLTAGTRIDQRQAKDGQPTPSSVVTLAVTPSDGERIALASSEGRITLALRNPLDVEPTDTPGIKVTRLMKG